MPIQPRRRFFKFAIACVIMALLGAAPLNNVVIADATEGGEIWADAALRRAAEAGDADAQFRMGQAFALGNGVSEDAEAAA